MRRILGNSAMSLFLIAGFLVWQVHKGLQNGTMTGAREGIFIAGAVLTAALGMAGMKERHRREFRNPDDEIRNPNE